MARKKVTVEQEAPTIELKHYEVLHAFDGYVIDKNIFGKAGEILELEPRYAEVLPHYLKEAQ